MRFSLHAQCPGPSRTAWAAPRDTLQEQQLMRTPSYTTDVQTDGATAQFHTLTHTHAHASAHQVHVCSLSHILTHTRTRANSGSTSASLPHRHRLKHAHRASLARTLVPSLCAALHGVRSTGICPARCHTLLCAHMKGWCHTFSVMGGSVLWRRSLIRMRSHTWRCHCCATHHRRTQLASRALRSTSPA